MSQGQRVITEQKDNRSNRTVQAAWGVLAVWVEELDFRRIFPAFLIIILILPNIQAQYRPRIMTLNPGEEIKYDVYLKWGLLMPRAGEARVSFNQSIYKGEPVSLYRLIFHTANIFETIYKMRDTLNCYYNSDNVLFYSPKHTIEGGYDLMDELTFTYTGEKTSIHSLRYTPTVKKIDTTLMVSSGYVFDMLGATFYVRTLDRKNLKIGDVFPCTVITGRSLIPTSFRYEGQAIVERDNIKYNTHYYVIDVHDEVFSRKKASAEVWIGDDDNYIPIKIRTKLIIGYAEVHYKSSVNLKNPLNCRAEIKK